jgi:2-oxoglutarate dehydrogenase E1 component
MQDKQNKNMDRLSRNTLLDGTNAAYLETVYEAYLENPGTVEEHWREYFDQLPQVDGHEQDVRHSRVRDEVREHALHPPHVVASTTPANEGVVDFEHERKQVRVLNLIQAYRAQGHLVARVNPLNRPLPDQPELSLDFHGLSEQDLDTFYDCRTLAGPDVATLYNIVDVLKRTYTQSIGAEYMHVLNTEEREWIQNRLESVVSSPTYSPKFRHFIIERLTAAEGLERYLHTRYVGQKRFSLEGGESLIPLLDELIQRAGRQGIQEVILGMAHRGRLNVLINVLGKSPSKLFSEFEGKHDDTGRTGDVKYHQGFSSEIRTPGGPVHLAMAFNPSHLEIIGPVVEGSTRSRQDNRGDREGIEVLPVVVHGDAAFAGQGVVMETLNMSQTRGFSTKGTVHIVVNNQIGFTTSFHQDARSTFYCTDVAKMVNTPIFHVNADDPEAVMLITQVALDYRMTFHKDVVIDLICYRRQGHNEADEPAVTQPRMYQQIRALPTTREIYAKRLVNEGVLEADEPAQLVNQIRRNLEEGHNMVPHLLDRHEIDSPYRVDWTRYWGHDWDHKVDTAVSRETLEVLAKRLDVLPDDFELHPRVARIVEDRRRMMAGEQPVDWGFAEIMAYATLVHDGYKVRLSGQDSGRGTFFHRHAVLHNQADGSSFIPLRQLNEDSPRFLVIDSLLSEEAVLAFEYGYSASDPDTLVIWEAQFGDFANNAQVVIDQFIASGEQKWGRLSGLTMFLPHGFEGQGPEHSSARLERYLQLCAQHNIQVCSPTTPAQTFHMLRRQMRRLYRKPLIVMTPKSLLRHKLAVSNLEAMVHGQFAPVLPEIDEIDPARVERLILCSGKVYYDLLETRRERELENVAIIRLEQLYPFPSDEVDAQLDKYDAADHVIWCQEEPLNQGAWYNIQHRIRALLADRHYLQHVTRPAAAAPAVGYFSKHQEQQTELVVRALGLPHAT